jgi:hypothetical protein
MRSAPFPTRCITLALALTLTAGIAAVAEAACSCTGMTINHATGAKVPICSNANIQQFVTTNECTQVAGDASNGCQGYAYRYDCDTGPNNLHSNTNPLQQQTGFGIDAVVTGNAGQCQTGHSLQQTITGRSSENTALHQTPASGNVTVGTFSAYIKAGVGFMPNVGTTYSNGNPEFGADNYADVTAQDVLIESNNGHIKWWDNPDQQKRANEHGEWLFRYFSFVRGSGGGQSCGCVYTITVDWDVRTPNPTTTTYAIDPDSPACHF